MMIVIISVRVCLIYEPWNHSSHIIEGGTCDDRFRVGFGHELWNHL